MIRYLLILVWAVAAIAALPPIPRLDGRIIGGHPVSIKDYSYQISLQYRRGGHFCGGSILSRKVILTSAHCASEGPPSNFKILYGTEHLYSGGAKINVSEIFAHPDYSSKSNDFDVSLVYLNDFIQFGDSAQPIKRTRTPQDESNLRSATISGWGAISINGGSPPLLYAAEVKEYTNKACNDIYGSITDQMICFASPGADSCTGDSGGPLVDIVTKEQVGIISWGISCAHPSFPGVYSNIYTLNAWIEEHSRK
ncbi:hypothetical protein FQA39_LY16231 [Lamprigera yunnana]|nr:hypothetical protein FQA39_LY16231 [Lamprigera yunnana]